MNLKKPPWAIGDQKTKTCINFVINRIPHGRMSPESQSKTSYEYRGSLWWGLRVLASSKYEEEELYGAVMMPPQLLLFLPAVVPNSRRNAVG